MKNFRAFNIVGDVKKSLGVVAITVAGLLASSEVMAYTADAATYYYDNTYSNWEDVYMRIGRGEGDMYVSVYQMSKVSGNANLYSVTLSNDWENYSAVQFAAVDGYKNGIYNGNSIPSGQKTAYIKENLGPQYPTFVGFSTISDGFRDISGAQQMGSSLGRSKIQINNGSWTDASAFNGSNLGVFASSFTIKGQATVSNPATSLVSATMNYSNNSGPFQAQTLNGGADDNGVKTASSASTITVPSTPGNYKLGIYYKFGGVYDSNNSQNYVATYTVPGFTGSALGFGAVSVGQTKELTENVTGVYGNTEDLSVVIKNPTVADVFSLAASTIAISDNKGSVKVSFTPPSGDDPGTEYSADLKITLTYQGGTIAQTYKLTGTAKENEIKVKIAQNETFSEGASTGPKATVYGYIQQTNCQNITVRGFKYCTGADCTLTTDWMRTAASSPLQAGDTWTYTTGDLTPGTIYRYKAFVNDGTADFASLDIREFTAPASKCAYDFSGDTVYVQVDTAFTANDDCALKYMNLDRAIKAVKNNALLYNSTSKKLLKNVVITVAYSTATYSGAATSKISGGNEKDDQHMNIIEDINNTTDYTDFKKLIIRSADPLKQTKVEHVTIRNSKNIVLYNLYVKGRDIAYTNGYDNAIDIDIADKVWTGLSCGSFAKADITIKNCYITSKGFTCIHVSAYDGVTFENNDIKADLPDGSAGKENANTNYWGASAKFIQCMNIKFLRNNFRGSHATSIWFQGVRGALVMNNVFWNDNDSYYSDYANNSAFIRLVTQIESENEGVTGNWNKHLTFAYNTFYLADYDDTDDDPQRADHNFDFFRLGSNYEYDTKNHYKLASYLNQNVKGSIKFMYNNCYSYDDGEHSAIGANTTGSNLWYISGTENDWCDSFAKNNFWSKKDLTSQPQSNFAIPVCDNGKKYFINVENLMCSTACSDPSDLIIKGSVLNLGSAMSTDNSGLGDNTYYNDRLHADNGADAVRKTNGEWTLGAYQQSTADQALTEILWLGTKDSDWDNRGNWYRMDGKTPINCVDILSPDLKVYIPAPGSSVYSVPDNMKIPYLPKFTGERTKNSAESVNAGQGVDQTSTKFANSIELEYGAALHGVSNLKDDVRRYTEVTNHFEAGRSEWILVGTVVKPFTDGSKESTRLIQSGDYYLYQLPHVYMHQAEANGETVNWNNPFTQLDEQVPYDKVFSIKLPDQYGPLKQKAKSYYKFRDPSMTGDATVSRTYNFNGWFLNDEVYPEYKVDGNTLLCNTYPANIDIAEAIKANNGDFKVYNYSIKNFVDKENGEIKSQNGFLFCPNGSNNGYFRITKDMLLDTSTKYKSAVVKNPYFTVLAINTNGDGGSVAVIKYDELKADKYVESVDLLNTVIENTPTQPEISVAMYSKELDKVVVPDLTKSIPLKLVCGAKMTVEFGKYEMLDIEKAELEDRETGETYDLLKENPQIALAKGTYEGRFYLNLGEIEEPLPTDVDDVTSGAATIDIYGNGKSVIITSSENVMLKSAEITDMAGRTTYVTLKNAHYNKVNIKGVQGVYVVKAIGDIKSETTKVIVK